MARTQHSESVEPLIAAFVERLLDVVEHEIDVRSRILAAEWMEVALTIPAASQQLTISPIKTTPSARAPMDGRRAERPADIAAMDATNRTAGVAAPLIRRERSRTRVRTSSTTRSEPPASAAPSPEQEWRDAEFVRLRALLKPTGHDDVSEAARIGSARASTIVVDPPADPFRLLEDEIRNQAHGLAQLPPTCCTARIAAWAGRVRSYEETNGNRVAAEFLLDKLRVLARAMDSGRIEALNESWRTTDWPSYIRANDALAEAPPKKRELAESLSDPSGDADYRDIWS